MPVLYVFGQQPIDMQDCQRSFQQLFPNLDQPVIIMCDVEYSYAAQDLTQELAKTYKHIIPTVIQTESTLQHLSGTQKPTCGSHEERMQQGQGCCGGKRQCAEQEVSVPVKNMEGLKAEMKRGGRYFELPESIPIEECAIFFVGSESLTLTNIMMVHNKCPVSLNVLAK